MKTSAEQQLTLLACMIAEYTVFIVYTINFNYTEYKCFLTSVAPPCIMQPVSDINLARWFVLSLRVETSEKQQNRQ